MAKRNTKRRKRKYKKRISGGSPVVPVKPPRPSSPVALVKPPRPASPVAPVEDEPAIGSSALSHTLSRGSRTYSLHEGFEADMVAKYHSLSEMVQNIANRLDERCDTLDERCDTLDERCDTLGEAVDANTDAGGMSVRRAHLEEPVLGRVLVPDHAHRSTRREQPPDWPLRIYPPSSRGPKGGRGPGHPAG
jgi:hypothetical protein